MLLKVTKKTFKVNIDYTASLMFTLFQDGGNCYWIVLETCTSDLQKLCWTCKKKLL